MNLFLSRAKLQEGKEKNQGERSKGKSFHVRFLSNPSLPWSTFKRSLSQRLTQKKKLEKKSRKFAIWTKRADLTREKLPMDFGFQSRVFLHSDFGRNTLRVKSCAFIGIPTVARKVHSYGRDRHAHSYFCTRMSSCQFGRLKQKCKTGL